MSPRKARGVAGDKTICLPIEDGIKYEDLVKNPHEYRAYLDKMMEKYPEIFPLEIEKGYKLQGLVQSKRQKLITRRIRLKKNKEAYSGNHISEVYLSLVQQAFRKIYYPSYD